MWGWNKGEVVGGREGRPPSPMGKNDIFPKGGGGVVVRNPPPPPHTHTLLTALTVRVMPTRVKTIHLENYHISLLIEVVKYNKECSPGVNWTKMIPTKPKEALQGRRKGVGGLGEGRTTHNFYTFPM